MSHPVLFARQPIFDDLLNTYAYRLTYRQVANGAPASTSAPVPVPVPVQSNAAEILVNAFSNILEKGHIRFLPALISCDAEWLYQGQLPEVPPETLILDVTEAMLVTPEILGQLTAMVEQGYRIAAAATAPEPLRAIAAIIRVDMSGFPATVPMAQADMGLGDGQLLMAEHLSSHEGYHACKAAGFSLFQGDFFARPQAVKGKKLGRNEIVMFQLIGEVNRSDSTPQSIAEVLQKDPELVTGLLRLVNSAAFRGRRSISSIEEAIVLLGLVELRKWVLLFALCHNKQVSNELIRHVLITAKMCESLAMRWQVESGSAFLTGILSGIDAILSMPMKEVLQQVSVQVEVRRALAGGQNGLGQLLLAVQNYMQGHWETPETESGQGPEHLAADYLAAVAWCNEFMEVIS